MVELIRPMLATAGSLPADDAAFAYEMKWDGVRAVVYLDGRGMRAMSRNDRDVTVSYPELAGLAGTRRCVLDGEIVALDGTGRASFGLLQRRMHVADPRSAARLAATTPVTYFAFDVLVLDGDLLCDLSYLERREVLAGLGVVGPHWQTPPHFDGGGAQALETSGQVGTEGVVAKRLTSRYLPGRRSRDWIKIKHTRTREVVIGGWRPGQGRRHGGIGSLLLGVPHADGLRYVGHVGTGFTGGMLERLRRLAEPLSALDSPFSTPLPRTHARDARWLVPTLVGEVEFTGWTTDGILRHPSWRGLRPDKNAGDLA